MPTEIIITPAPTPTPVPVTITLNPGMVINPRWDWSPGLNIPLWLLIEIACVFLIIVVILSWMFKLRRLASVNGWVESLKKLTPNDVQVWVITRVQRLFIECMTIKDNVLSSHDPLNISMWYVSSPMGVVRVGGQTAILVSEDLDRNRDPLVEIALCHNLDHFNENQEWLMEQARKKYQEQFEAARTDEERALIKKPQIIKPIVGFSNYEKYGRACLLNLHMDGLKIPPYNIFNPNRFRKYFPKGSGGMLFGGEIISEAREWNIDKKEKSFWEVHAFLLMAAGVVLIMNMAAWLVPL